MPPGAAADVEPGLLRPPGGGGLHLGQVPPQGQVFACETGVSLTRSIPAPLAGSLAGRFAVADSFGAC